MKTLVINLDRSPERLAAFRANNGFLSGLERFAAIDGKRIDRARLIADGLLDRTVAYTDGAIGVALSHLALWEGAARDGQALTVCEDDAVLNQHFERERDAIIAALAPTWDVILWGWNFDSTLMIEPLPGVAPCLVHFDQECLRRALRPFQALALSPRPFRLFRAFGLLCYSISPAGARKLRDACLPIRPLDVPVPGIERPVPNVGLDVMTNAAYPSVGAFACFPPLAVSPNEHATSLVQRR